MIKKIKKMLMPLFISTICGCICGYLVYDIYTKNLQTALTNDKVYLIESGTYDTYDLMRINSDAQDYIYFEEDGNYKTIVGMTKNLENVSKIKQACQKDSLVQEYLVNDSDLNALIESYDSEIANLKDVEEIKTKVQELLTKIKDNDNLKLLKYS